MDFETIKLFWKNKTEWKRVKEAQEYFERNNFDKNELHSFLESGWTIQDMDEALEMMDTNPIAENVNAEHIEKYNRNFANNTESNLPSPNVADVEFGDILKKIIKGE